MGTTTTMSQNSNGTQALVAAGSAVTVGQIVKLDPNGRLIPTETTDVSGAVGIAMTGVGTTGQSIQIAAFGFTSVLVDNACTFGNYIQLSNSKAGYGDCTSTWPTPRQEIGIASSAANTSAGAEVYITSFAAGGGGVGGGGNPTITTVAFSTTPAFSITGNDIFRMTLTGNVTSSTLTGVTPTKGMLEAFQITQDSTGSRTFVWPSGFITFPAVNYDPGSTTTAQFYYDGVHWQLTGPNGSANEVRYVSGQGNDSNDGLTWETAKKSLSAAYLSATNNTFGAAGVNIFVASGAHWGTTSPACNLNIMGGSDSQYNALTPPTCWINATKAANFIGVGGENTGFANGTAPVLVLSDDAYEPPLQLSNPGTVLSFQNLTYDAGYVGMRLGCDSQSYWTQSGENCIADQVHNITFKNFNGQINATPGAGPTALIGGGSFWLWFDHFGFQGTEGVNSAYATSLTRVSNVVSVVAATPLVTNLGNTLVPGQWIGVFNVDSDRTFEGHFQIVTVTDTTHFTYNNASGNNANGGPDNTISGQGAIILDIGNAFQAGDAYPIKGTYNSGTTYARGDGVLSSGVAYD
jgi:hypothetical protein